MATGRNIECTNVREWRGRARESWSAAVALALNLTPPMAMSATSRLYYSVYQGAVAFMLETRPDDALPADHGKFWNYLFSLPDDKERHTELGNLVQEVYGWRRKADYAEDDVTPENVRRLLARCKPLLGTIKVCEAS